MDTELNREGCIRQAVEGMLRVMRTHRKIIDKRFEGLGIHPGQHRTLMCLNKMGRMSSQKDVAEALDVSPACVARTLKVLSGAGYIDKAEGADGRCNAVSLLPEGEAIIKSGNDTFKSVDAGMFNGLTDDEIQSMRDMLSKLYDNLCAMEKEGE